MGMFPRCQMQSLSCVGAALNFDSKKMLLVDWLSFFGEDICRSLNFAVDGTGTFLWMNRAAQSHANSNA